MAQSPSAIQPGRFKEETEHIASVVWWEITAMVLSTSAIQPGRFKEDILQVLVEGW